MSHSEDNVSARGRKNRNKGSTNGTTNSTELVSDSFQEDLFVEVEEIQLTLEKKGKDKENNEDSNTLLNNKCFCHKNKENDMDVDLYSSNNSNSNTKLSLSSNQSHQLDIKKDRDRDREISETIYRELNEINAYGMPTNLFDEIQDIVNDVYLRNYNSNKNKNFSIFDRSNQVIIQQYNNQNKSKIFANLSQREKTDVSPLIMKFIIKGIKISLNVINIFKKEF